MRAGFFVVGLAALAVAGAAHAAPPHITPPDWLRRPDAADIADVYPAVARALGVEGRVVIGCDVDLKGLLDDCQSLSAKPAGLGFGVAAVVMSNGFQMTPALADGKPVAGGRVRIPIRFTLAADDATLVLPPVAPALLEHARQAAELSGLVDRLAAVRAAELDAIDAGGLASDPAVMTDALAALRDAWADDRPRLANAVAGAIAIRLTPAEISQWIAHLKSPGARKLAADKEIIGRATAAVQVAHVRRTMARAREAFCRRQDCVSDIDLAGMRQLAGAKPPIIDRPVWAQGPSPAQAQDAFPLSIQALRLSGWAILQCRVTTPGGLEACEVLVQGPRRLGFGAGALRVARAYRLSPDLLAQGAAGDTVNVPVYFQTLRDDPPAAIPPKPSRELNLARQIVRAQGLAERDHQLGDVGQRLFTSDRGLDDAVRRDAGEAFRGALIEDFPNLLDAQAAIYVETLTPAQLTDLAAFTQSPTGHLASGRDEVFNRLLTAALADLEAQDRATARAAFCRVRDCGLD